MISRNRWSHAGLRGCSVALAGGEAPGRVDHGRLPGLPLLRRHRLAVHDPFQHRRRRTSPASAPADCGKAHRIPITRTRLSRVGQVAAHRGAQRPAAVQRPQRHSDRVDEDRYHRARGGVAEELLQRLDGAVIHVHADRHRDVDPGAQDRFCAVVREVFGNVERAGVGAVIANSVGAACRYRTAASPCRRTRCSDPGKRSRRGRVGSPRTNSRAWAIARFDVVKQVLRRPRKIQQRAVRHTAQSQWHFGDHPLPASG